MPETSQSPLLDDEECRSVLVSLIPVATTSFLNASASNTEVSGGKEGKEGKEGSGIVGGTGLDPSSILTPLTVEQVKRSQLPIRPLGAFAFQGQHKSCQARPPAAPGRGRSMIPARLSARNGHFLESAQ